jgi:hypothetical protein
MSKHLPNLASVTLGFNTPAGVPTQTLGGSDGSINIKMKPTTPFWEVIDQINQVQLKITNPGTAGSAVITTYNHTLDDGTGKAIFASAYVGSINTIQALSTLTDTNISNPVIGATSYYNSGFKWVNDNGVLHTGYGGLAIGGATTVGGNSYLTSNSATATGIGSASSLGNGSTNINTFTIPSDYISGRAVSFVIVVSTGTGAINSNGTMSFGSLTSPYSITNASTTNGFSTTVVFTAAQVNGANFTAGQVVQISWYNATNAYYNVTFNETLNYMNSAYTVFSVKDASANTLFQIANNSSGKFTAGTPLTTLDDGTGKATFVSAFVGSINLLQAVSTLTDATISSPITNQLLTWNGLRWTNQNAPVIAISTSTDVQLSGLTNGQYLIYNASTSKWINTTPSYSFSNLSDYAVSGLAPNQILTYTGSNWTNSAITIPNTSGTSYQTLYNAGAGALQWTSALQINGNAVTTTAATLDNGTGASAFTSVSINGATLQTAIFNILVPKTVVASGNPPSPFYVDYQSAHTINTFTIPSDYVSGNAVSLTMRFQSPSNNYGSNGLIVFYFGSLQVSGGTGNGNSSVDFSVTFTASQLNGAGFTAGQAVTVQAQRDGSNGNTSYYYNGVITETLLYNVIGPAPVLSTAGQFNATNDVFLSGAAGTGIKSAGATGMTPSGGAYIDAQSGNVGLLGGTQSTYWAVQDQNHQTQLQVYNTNQGVTGAAVIKTYNHTLDDGTGKALFKTLGTTAMLSRVVTLPYTINSNGQDNLVYVNTTNGTGTLTLPTVPYSGAYFIITTSGSANTVTLSVDTTGTATLYKNGSTTGVQTVTLPINSTTFVFGQPVGTNWFYSTLP